MLGVLVGSAALIIILSVFNGFEGLILSMYNNLGPDLEITPAHTKHFNPKNAIAFFTRRAARLNIVRDLTCSAG